MDGTLTSLGEYFHGASRFARRTRRFLPKQDYPELVLQKAPYGAKYRKLRPVPAPRREGLHDEVAARCHQRRYIPEQPKVGILDRDNEVRRSKSHRTARSLCGNPAICAIEVKAVGS